MNPDDEIKQGIILPESSEIQKPLVDKSILDIETDISNMEYDDAKDYVVNITAYKKELQRTIVELETKIKYYYDKRPLAEQNPALLSEVDTEIHKLEEKRKGFIEDKLELDDKVKALTQKLQVKPKFSVQDLSPLLSQLELDFDETAHKTEELRIQDKLAELKKKMKGE